MIPTIDEPSLDPFALRALLAAAPAGKPYDKLVCQADAAIQAERWDELAEVCRRSLDLRLCHTWRQRVAAVLRLALDRAEAEW